MLVLGVESSCDETGLALYHSQRGLLSHALHSQVALHDAYGGVVPELASRDHIRRLLPLLHSTLQQAGVPLTDVDAVAYTEGPGLAGALLVGAGFGRSLAWALGLPSIGVHHLEGHLLSPLLAADAPAFPFIALLVSGGHTQLMQVDGVGRYRLLGETADDAAGEAFDKTAKLLGLPYPGGPALAALAEHGRDGRFVFPRPMLDSGNLDFSFSGLKTAVALSVRDCLLQSERDPTLDDRTLDDWTLDDQIRADIALGFEQAAVAVLVAKTSTAMRESGLQRLVVAGGVGANKRLRAALNAAGARHGFALHYPPFEFCTDNGAMIALAGCLRLQAQQQQTTSAHSASSDSPAGFAIRPRWDLASLAPAAG